MRLGAVDVASACRLEALRGALLIGVTGIVSEMCEDPFLRWDLIAIPLWHRIFMSLVGACLVLIYLQHCPRRHLTRLDAGLTYASAYMLALFTSHILRYLSQHAWLH